MTETVQILDCTIRDGSYVVDYQFTVEDTYLVAAGLANAGIRHIEVGHGAGLNAQQCGKGNAAISDAEYIRAARAAIPTDHRVGCFLIPGIGTEDSLRAAAAEGLGFVRIGIDVDDHAALAPFVKLGKSLGLEVWGNLMKSYLLEPKAFGEVCRQVSGYGVDVIALVDSAGGMRPSEVEAYTVEAKRQTAVPLAFHGHNNLSLAVANGLRFVECGGVYVDGTLGGIGRSGGNAATELLALLLTGRLAYPLDWKRLVEFADAMMEFCVPDHARPRATEIATGANHFHSSFREKIVEPAAALARASLFRTILNLSATSRKTVTPAAAAAAARAAAAEPRLGLQLANFPGAGAPMERLQAASLDQLAQRLRVQKGKGPRRRVVSVAPGVGAPIRIGPLRRGAGSLVAHVEVDGLESLARVQAALAGTCDFWMLDKHLAPAMKADADAPWFSYDDGAVVAQAVVDALQILSGSAARVAVVSDNESERSAIARSTNVVAAGPADALVACSAAAPATAHDVAQLRAAGVVLLVRARALAPEALAAARERELFVWRVDCGPALVAEAERLLATHDRYGRAAGNLVLGSDTHIVAGGTVGNSGDIIVDSKVRPRFILGVADGLGGVRPLEADDAQHSRRVQQWIADQWGL